MMEARRIDGVKVVEVIEVSFVRGSGDGPKDPVRRVTAWFDLHGNKLGERDDWADEEAAEAEDNPAPAADGRE
jgi:hypothetical protein